MPAGWNPPTRESIPANEAGRSHPIWVSTSHENAGATSARSARRGTWPIRGSNLACGNCHQEGGTKIYGIPWMGVTWRYPQYSSRYEQEVTLEDRVNDCMERSMNGRGLPQNSREMKAIIAYMTWLSKDLPRELGRPAQGQPDAPGPPCRSRCREQGLPGILPVLPRR